MLCVEETSSQWYTEELIHAGAAGHQLKDKLAKIRPSVSSVTEEVDLIGEEETTVMTIPERNDALLVFKESIELKKGGC
jgi:hypothetical protein